MTPLHTHRAAPRSVARLATAHVSPAEWLVGHLVRTIALGCGALASSNARRVFLAIAVLGIPLQIQKHFFLREQAGDLGSLGGLQVSLTNCGLVALYAGWLIQAAARPGLRRSRWCRRAATTLPATLLVVAYAVSALGASDRTLAMFQVVSVAELFLLFWFIASKTASRDDTLFIVRLVLVGLLAQSTLMLAQGFGIVGDIDAYGITARAEFVGDSRVSGTIGSPNPAAAYLAITMTLGLGALLARSRRADWGLAAVACAAATLPLIFTLSRGGWIAFLVGAATVVCVAARQFRARILVAIVTALVVLVVPFRDSIEQRLSGDDNGSSAARMPLNQLAAAMIEDHPLAGVGANNFAVAMPPYVARGFRGDFVYTVHNQYLLVWTETGVFGLLVFVWFLYAIVREGWRGWAARDPVLSPLALGCAAAVIGLAIQMNFDPARAGADTHLLWLFAGLVTAIGRSTPRLAHA